MSKLSGRKKEIDTLIKATDSPRSELIALYGRRRVGKTFLVRETLGDSSTYFELTGTNGADTRTQLGHFVESFRNTFGIDLALTPPADWETAFKLLARAVESRKGNGKAVIFLDELPWLVGRKSGFMGALEYFWNSFASARRDVVAILCGSAGSWIVKKVIQNHGGLHNRLTGRIRLQPFTLNEVAEYFHDTHIAFGRRQIAEFYMALGGIPYYLDAVEHGMSASQNIGRICFSKDGLLSGEYENLFSSLFENHVKYMDCIKALAERGNGLSRDEIVSVTGINSGGTLTAMLNALIESDFISRYAPFGKKERSAIYKLTDEFCLFYHKWIRRYQASDLLSEAESRWADLHGSPRWNTWAGYAFERLCLRHVPQIKKALGISGIHAESCGNWSNRGDNGSIDTQIDLLIDRADGCINLCEMKYSRTEFTISKSYAESLRKKMRIFRDKTGTGKTIFLTMVTSNGTRKNKYFDELVSNQIVLDDLFENA